MAISNGKKPLFLRPNERSIGGGCYMQIMEDIGDKKQAIFESTLELIKDHGFHGAPMSQVAKNAGVAAGTIYHYFQSKEQLICELYSYNREQVKRVIADVLQEKGTLKEKFVKVWISLYKFYVQEPNVLIFFEQFVNSPFSGDKYPDHFRGELYSFFSEGIKAGKLKPLKPEVMLVTVMGTISSTAKLQLFGKTPITKSDLEGVVDLVWTGVKK